MKIIFRKLDSFGSYSYIVIYPECKNTKGEVKIVVRNIHDIIGIFYGDFNETLSKTIPVTLKECEILKCNYKPELIEIIIPNERNCEINR